METLHKIKKAKYKRGDILRTNAGSEFVVDNIYRVGIFVTIFYSGYGVNDTLGLITITEENIAGKIGYKRNWKEAQQIRNK